MSKYFHIQTSYIDNVKDNHQKMKSLALYLKIKRRYKNGVVYNYTPEKLQQELNVTIYEARKYVGVMVQMGLAEKQYNKKGVRLRLSSFRKLKEEQHGNSAKLTIHTKDKISVVVSKLRFSLLKYHLIDKQKYIQKVYSGLAKNDRHHATMGRSEYKSLKRGMKNLKRLGYDVSSPGKVKVDVYAGYRKMAEITGVSIGSVQGFLKKLTSIGYINGYKWLIEKTDLHPEAIKYVKGMGRYYVSNNTVYLHRGTSLLVGS